MKYVKLPHCVIVKTPSLLPMLYKPAELAAELGIPVRTLGDWIKMNIPHLRDTRNHIWIHGNEFINWVSQQMKKPAHQKLKDGEGYCFSCGRIVEMKDCQVNVRKGNLVNISGACPICKGKIARGGRKRG